MLGVKCSTFVFILLAAFASARGQTAYSPDANKLDAASFEANWHDADRDRDVPAKIYYPTTAPAVAAKSPIIIFSHGLGGSRQGWDHFTAHCSD